MDDLRHIDGSGRSNRGGPAPPLPDDRRRSVDRFGCRHRRRGRTLYGRRYRFYRRFLRFVKHAVIRIQIIKKSVENIQNSKLQKE